MKQLIVKKKSIDVPDSILYGGWGQLLDDLDVIEHILSTSGVTNPIQEPGGKTGKQSGGYQVEKIVKYRP